jgi:hypothetical protein
LQESRRWTEGSPHVSIAAESVRPIGRLRFLSIVRSKKKMPITTVATDSIKEKNILTALWEIDPKSKKGEKR